ncbi:MAG: helix-turn-helix domain-containing protein [Flavobacterium sp. JAD_PAG50586_2]|nr:MAG: helix-turn-helix domain-containing protein [Flavobacterium sp. JAD_PAG50586_2]
MKAKETISTLLGLKQEQVAMLLQVSRSKWSMYELGLRSLPAASMEILAELLAIIETAEEINMQPSAEERKEHLATIEKQIKENIYQQRSIADKISALEIKQKALLRVSHLKQHYKDTGKNKAEYQKGLAEHFLAKAQNTAGKNSWSQQRQYEIKMKTLQQEEKFLREELEGFGK